MPERNLALVLAMLLWLGPVAAWAQGPVVGLLDGWGVAHPGAAFVDGEWRSLSAPSDLAAVQRFTTGSAHWTLLDSRAGERRAIRLGAVVEFRDAFFQEWGLLTDFPPLEMTANRRPVTVGIVFSGEGDWELIEALPASALWSSGVEAGLRALHWDRASGGESRQAFRISPRWIYAESQRLSTSPALCPEVQIVQAWMRDAGSGLEVVGFERTQTDCDGKGIEWFRPLAALELEGRSFVVGQVAGWEAAGLGIVELSSDEPVHRSWPW